MIDGEDQEVSAVGAGPGGGHQDKGQGVSSSRQGHGDGRRRGAQQAAVEDVGDLRGQTAHLAWVRAAAARPFTAGVALG